jgi:hypothetical protein
MVTIKLPPDNEIMKKVRAALEAGESVRLDDGGEVITLRPEAPLRASENDDIWANYDPQRALDAFEQATGILDGVDVEQLLAELRERRGQDSIGRPA